MAIGPTTSAILPVPNDQRGPLSPASDQRRTEASGARRDNPAIAAGEAELPDPSDQRRLDREQAAERIRLLNPNAPRGSIVNILV